jgi:dephospho-CoA kinase
MRLSQRLRWPSRARRRSLLSAKADQGRGLRGNREVPPRKRSRLVRRRLTRASRPTLSIPRIKVRATQRATPHTRPKRLRRSRTKPLAVAITGGIGAGKSEALAAFARHGTATISSDAVVHELYDDPEVQAALAERFGTSDRQAVREQAVGDREALLWLEGLLHPRVLARTEAWREDLSRLPDPPALAVNEVPLLYEAGAEDQFDAVVVITAPRQLRAERARGRLDQREKRLIPEEEKVQRADFSYVNDGSLEDLDAFVAGVVTTLTER